MAIAYVLITCDLGFDVEIIDEIKQLEQFESVKEVRGTFGAYDIISKVENIEQEKIRETIIWNIRKIPYVRSTLTLMGIEEQN